MLSCFLVEKLQQLCKDGVHISWCMLQIEAWNTDQATVSPLSTPSFSSSFPSVVHQLIVPGLVLLHFVVLERTLVLSSTTAGTVVKLSGKWWFFLVSAKGSLIMFCLSPNLDESGKLKQTYSCAMIWTLSCYTWRIMVQVVKHPNSKKTTSQLCGNHSSFLLKVFTNSSRNLTLNLKNSVITHIVIPMYFGSGGSLSKGCRDFLEEDVCFLKKL